ncbi:MAG: hypothetical protein ACI9VR_004845 [Cognaticolwellia sp.]|jgi:hypothetical protein
MLWLRRGGRLVSASQMVFWSVESRYTVEMPKPETWGSPTGSVK